MNYTGIFTYNTANLIIDQQSLVTSIIAIVFFIILIFVIRKIFLYIVGLYWIFQDNKMIANRKKVLTELVIMKDLQSELEKEIEQATLKAAFQN